MELRKYTGEIEKEVKLLREILSSNDCGDQVRILTTGAAPDLAMRVLSSSLKNNRKKTLVKKIGKGFTRHLGIFVSAEGKVTSTAAKQVMASAIQRGKRL